ncbi:hypothetical protein OG21DRAFT_1594361 [Imleria badia]|nr:hypothetical protein OG21DRAFT_1594361 [Imleria badia]
MIAFQRRNATSVSFYMCDPHLPLLSATRRTDRPPPSPPRKAPVDPDDFGRRLRISPPVRQQQPKQHNNNKLYNPDTDPIPTRRTHDPEPVSDATSSSYLPRNTAQTHQRLFDHRKDDPVRFSVLARPSKPSSKGPPDHLSASSTSSYAHSIASSSFTLSSGTTDNSSASSALFEGKPHEEPGNNAFAVQLKKLYRSISALEAKILSEDTDDNPDDSRVLLHPRARDISDDQLEQQKWLKLISDHKRLAEMMHNLMEISLAPSVPASLRVIPTKYNIIIRLWTHAFHKLLEALRRASFSSPLALEHLQDFIYFAYTFYTGLLEEPTLKSFRAGWLEALGDLARYRMAVAAMVTSNNLSGSALTADAVSQANAISSDDPAGSHKSKSQINVTSSSYRPAARIDDSPTPSVGIVAARMMQVEPEKELWRTIAKEWYAQGIADTPGAGKLHHHLGLLSREVEFEELRAVYHFVKSMTTLHPFTTSRESILPVWSSTAQSRRTQPDATVAELFVLLHGMLFTNIQLDNFAPTLSRFLERLEIEGAEERQWIMMAVTNIGAIMDYGRPGGVLRRAGAGTRDAASSTPFRVFAKRNVPAQPEEDPEEKRMDVDDDALKSSPYTSPILSDSQPSVELSQAFKFAMQLAFSMLSFVLRKPTRKASPFAESTLNPYLAVLLTFLATVSKHPETLVILERFIPWEDLAVFFTSIPKNIHVSQGLHVPAPTGAERWVMLTSGCTPPLAEDWSMRGMEWVGRKVFERGYWKSGEDRRVEIEVLDAEEGNQLTDGIIQDEDADERGSEVKSETARRWTRIARTAVNLAGLVDGFTWVQGTREWKVDGVLEAKARRWRDEDRHEREQEELRRRGRRWTDDAMDVEVDDAEVDESSEGEDDEEDSEEVKALKARRRYLRSLLASAQRLPPSSSTQRSKRHPRRPPASGPTLNVVSGYSVLVLDTNILLSSMSLIASIVESLRWTVVIPVPVIMELDGLSSNASQLGEAAQEAVAYITSHIRSHATSLKVQTSKGNYLTSLSVRTEQVEFSDESSWDRCMDDLILKAAIWQDEHWIDRSALLKAGPAVRDTSSAVKVVLLSLDRNLRLKARSRQLSAAGEKDLAAILACGT